MELLLILLLAKKKLFSLHNYCNYVKEQQKTLSSIEKESRPEEEYLKILKRSL